MISRSKSAHSALISTHDIDAPLPRNTKYLSGNIVSRLLIKEFMRVLVELTMVADPRTILDVGCGEGLVIRQLQALRDELQIDGVDVDVDLLRIAREIVPGATSVVGSAYKLPFPNNRHDLVVCTEVLEHLETPSIALAEIVRVAKDYCLLSVPNEPWWRLGNMIRGSYLANWGNTPGHINHWSKASFANLLDQYLDVIDIRQPFPWTMILGKVRLRERS